MLGSLINHACMCPPANDQNLSNTNKTPQGIPQFTRCKQKLGVLSEGFGFR